MCRVCERWVDAYGTQVMDLKKAETDRADHELVGHYKDLVDHLNREAEKAANPVMVLKPEEKPGLEEGYEINDLLEDPNQTCMAPECNVKPYAWICPLGWFCRPHLLGISSLTREAVRRLDRKQEKETTALPWGTQGQPF